VPNGSVAGATALPLPAGDAVVLRAAAAGLRQAERTARTTSSLRGHLSTALPFLWTGAAAEAAVHESTVLVRRSTTVLLHLSAAASALDRYATALEHAQHGIRRLQHEWDSAVDQHERSVAVVRLRLGTDVDAARLIVRLTAEHQTLTDRLSLRHAELEQELARAAVRAAATLAALDDDTLPRAAEPTPTALRDSLIHDLPIASGAAAAADIRGVALSDAESARRLLRALASASATPSSVRDLVRAFERRAGDPRYAQALVEELGVDGVHRLVLALGNVRADVGLDVARRAVGALGVLLLTAVAPPGADGRDARTARQVESAAALIGDDLARSLDDVVGDDSDHSRATGYWLIGQLIVGARQQGWSSPMSSGLLRRLAAGAASAEIGETRDADAERTHGSTLGATDGARFASLFDDADLTGDALHTLLLEAGDDPAAVIDLLSAPVDGHGVTNARGGQLVLAEALVRRWVTYEASAPSTPDDLTLATTDDLGRLMEIAGVASEPAAALRARVLSEIGSTSSFAQQEHSTVAIYEGNTALLESTAVAWVLEMPEAIDATLRRPHTVTADTWSTTVGAGHQPLLRPEELTGVIGALAIGVDGDRAAKAPAPTYQGLINGELDRAGRAARSADRSTLDAVATRIGFFEQAASAALVAVARRQDVANRSMWRALAEAKALAVAWREGPRAMGAALATLVSGGTNRTAEDDLAIALVRSRVELEQSRADERRTASLTVALDSLRGASAQPVVPTAALLAAGARRAPELPTSAQVLAARRQEQLDALGLVLGDVNPKGAQGPRQHDLISVIHELPRGRSAHTRLVESETELRTLFASLIHGAEPMAEGSYPGVGFRRPDGVMVYIRDRSSSGGATIDLVLTDGSTRKVHIR
ncbi:MAG TPA: hypothetical protein VFN43_07130, partial [Humibacillus sp.]|nr:hypothetical protein [Humibacillus sp.]